MIGKVLRSTSALRSLPVRRRYHPIAENDRAHFLEVAPSGGADGRGDGIRGPLPARAIPSITTRSLVTMVARRHTTRRCPVRPSPRDAVGREASVRELVPNEPAKRSLLHGRLTLRAQVSVARKVR